MPADEGQVRRQRHIAESEEGTVGGQGLFGKDVQAGAGKVSVAQQAEQGIVVDEIGACRIDET